MSESSNYCDWFWNGGMSCLGGKIWVCRVCRNTHIKKNNSSKKRKPSRIVCQGGE
jgi:hypothetical protein